MKYRIIGTTIPAVEIKFDAPGETMYTQSGGMSSSGLIPVSGGLFYHSAQLKCSATPVPAYTSSILIRKKVRQTFRFGGLSISPFTSRSLRLYLFAGLASGCHSGQVSRKTKLTALPPVWLSRTCRGSLSGSCPVFRN